MALFSPAPTLFLVLASSGSTLAGSLPATGSEGGFQQQYAQQFAHYMSSGDQGKGGNVPPFASGTTSGDFQEYIKDYAGPHGTQQSQSSGYHLGNATAGDYYHKYVNFMGQAGAGNATAPSAEASLRQGGSYQQYLDKYGDYHEFMHQDGARQSQSGNYQQYMDGYAPNLTNASDSKEWAAYYMRKHAGEFQTTVKENSSNYSAAFSQQFAGSHMTHDETLQRWGRTFRDKYAPPAADEHSTHRQAAASSIPASASGCHNVSELKAWRDAKLGQITSYVPTAYRASAEDAVERTFHSNQARIEREQAIQAQHLANEEAGKAAREGSLAPANLTAAKVAKQGSPAPADEKDTKAAQEGPAESADDETGKAAQEGPAAPGQVQEPAPANASSDGGEQENTNQGSADQATARPPPMATNASALQLAGEVPAELLTKTHMDRSVASIAALAALVALFGAYVSSARRRQRVMQSEGYVNLIAEP